MSGQSHALDVIGANIANVTTGGYKRSETSFRTVLSDTVVYNPGNPDAPGPASTQSDLGGVRAYDSARIGQPGEYAATGRNLDIAVSGRGFFVLNSEPDGSGATIYGRDGQLSVANVAGTSEAGAVGRRDIWSTRTATSCRAGRQRPTAASLPGVRPLRCGSMPNPFTSLGAATTAARLAMNLPADDAAGATETYTIDVFDSAAKQRPVQLSFTKQAANAWSVIASGGPPPPSPSPPTRGSSLTRQAN